MKRESIPDITFFRKRDIDNDIKVNIDGNDLVIEIREFTSRIDLQLTGCLNILKIYDASDRIARTLYNKMPVKTCMLTHSKDMIDRLWWAGESNAGIDSLKDDFKYISRRFSNYSTKYNEGDVTLIQSIYKIDIPRNSVNIFISDKFNSSSTGFYDHRKFLKENELDMKSPNVKFINWTIL